MQKQIKNILVPVNFSQASNNALQTAIAMCKRHGANLHLVNVFETELLVPQAGMQVPATSITAELEASRKDNLKTLAAAVARNHEIECAHHFETGFIPYIICAKATELHCDLIVAGTDYSSKLKKLLRGNNTMAILRHADVPVLTVPARRKVLDFKQILFPVRPVLNAIEKYKNAAAIMKKNGSNVLVMGLVNKQQGSDIAVVKSMMDSVSGRMAAERIDVEHKIRFANNAAGDVLATAQRKNVDLVIITATLKRGLKQFFFGGYVQQLINNAVMPVLFVKPALDADERELQTLLAGTAHI